MLKVFLYVDGSIDIEQFIYKNKEQDIYYAKDISDLKQNLYKLYDLYVLSSIDKDDFNKKLERITEHTRKELIVYTREEDIQFDKEKYYFVLAVRSGEYEDTVEEIIGIFNNRLKAYEYYKNYCEVDWDDMEKNNKLYDEYEKNEPIEDDYTDSDDNINWSAYEEDYAKYWEDKIPNTRLYESDITTCYIKKVKILD